ARDVRGVGPREIAIRPELLVQLAEGARAHELVAEAGVLRVLSVAPVDAVRLGERRDSVDPLQELRVLGRGGAADGGGLGMHSSDSSGVAGCAGLLRGNVNYRKRRAYSRP